MLSKKGFTLIELLVVIAIIAILAAILFPVFARARMKAYQTQCLNNIKNIATATKIYISDYDSLFWHTPEGSGPRLVNEGYVTDIDIMHSPLVTKEDYSYLFNGCYEWGGNNSCRSWGGLSWKSYSAGTGVKYIGANETWVEDPANTVMWVDGNYYSPYSTGGDKYYYWGVPGTYTFTQAQGCCNVGSGGGAGYNCIVYRYNEGTNVAWVDGHASWVKRDTGLREDIDGCLGTTRWDLGPDTMELTERLFGGKNISDAPDGVDNPGGNCDRW